MLKNSLRLLVGIAAMHVCMAQAKADPVTIDFEGYAGFTPLTTQYNGLGVDFSGSDTTILQAPFYNSGGYPPHSGTNVAYSGSNGYILATSTSGTWSHVSLWYTSAITGLFIDAYDSGNNLLNSSFAGTDYGTNAYLDVSAPNIAYVKIHDSGNYFTIDDLGFTPNTPNGVPEPTSIALLSIGALGMLGYGLKRRKS